MAKPPLLRATGQCRGRPWLLVAYASVVSTSPGSRRLEPRSLENRRVVFEIVA